MKVWRNYSDLEMLNILKTELDRLGKENYGRTAFQKNRDSENVPAPTVYMHRFDMKWDEILKMVGIDYDPKASLRINGSKGGVIGGKIGGKIGGLKTKKGRWDQYTDEQIFEIVKDEIQKKAIRTAKEYVEKRDIETTPSISTLKTRFGSWKSLVLAIGRSK